MESAREWARCHQRGPSRYYWTSCAPAAAAEVQVGTAEFCGSFLDASSVAHGQYAIACSAGVPKQQCRLPWSWRS